MVGSCPPSDDLVRLLDGELTENRANDVRAHVASCRSCRGELAACERLVADLATPLAARPDAQARVLERIAAETANAPRVARSRLRIAGFGALAAGAAALVIMLNTNGDRVSTGDEGTFTARGTPSAPSLARDVDVSLYASGNSLARLRDGAVVSADTAFAVSYRNLGDRAYALVFAVDHEREVHWIAPVYLSSHDDPASLPLPTTTTDVVLPRATLLDAPAAGALHLFVVVSRRPLHVSDVERMTGGIDAAALQRSWPDANIRAFTLQIGSPR
jgi:hypothetical protein